VPGDSGTTGISGGANTRGGANEPGVGWSTGSRGPAKEFGPGDATGGPRGWTGDHSPVCCGAGKAWVCDGCIIGGAVGPGVPSAHPGTAAV
jgi:hypothetical protein